MEKGTFVIHVHELFDYYGFKHPEPNRVGMWYRKVEHIPNQAINYIKNYIENNNDSMPRNLPKAFNLAYDMWKRQRPATEVQKETPCDECGGSGLLYAWKYIGKYKSGSYVFRCSACKNWERHVGDYVPQESIASLLEKGWTPEIKIGRVNDIPEISEGFKEKLINNTWQIGD